MRINFDAQYGEIAKLLNVPNNPSAVNKGGVPFGELLGSISPDRPPEEVKKVVKPKTSKVELPKESLNLEPKEVKIEMQASLNPKALELKTPELLPIEPKVIEEKPSVKSPTILSAKRIPSAGQLSNMSREERIAAVRPMIEEVGKEQGIDPALGMGVAAMESSFNPLAVSKDGHHSKGLFQLLDGTGLDMQRRLNSTDNYDPFDPEQNTKYGMAYLRYLHDVFSTGTALSPSLTTVPAANSSSLEKLAVAAYNAGEGRVAAAQARAKRSGNDASDYDQISRYLPESTQKYVRNVMYQKSIFGDENDG